MNIRLLTALALVIMLGLCSATADTVDSWEQAKLRAAETGKLLVVDFWADWCGPCKRFNADSENDQQLVAAIDGIVLFKTDAEREGKPLADEYLVGSYPTYAVMTSDGEVLRSWSGYYGPEDWVERIAEVQADPTTMDAKAERHAASPNAEDAVMLAEYHESREEYDQAETYYEDAKREDPDRTFKYDDSLFYCLYLAHRADKASFGRLAARADAIVARGDAATAEDLYYVARYMTASARRADRLEQASSYITVAFDRLSASADEDEAAQRSLARLSIDHALIVEKDAERAIALKKASYGEGWLADPNAMNGFAWWCFENELNLEEAEQIARDAVELATNDVEKIQILDTAAEICNLRGDCSDAVDLMQRALELDPTNERTKEQVERFEKNLEAMG